MDERERWHRIREILHELVAMDPAVWEAHIAFRCQGDSEMSAELRDLARDLSDLVRFTGPSSRSTVSESPEWQLGSGTWIGPYELVERIGEGGFGEVFLARQREPVRRTVAFKILLPEMSSREVLARFEGEKQALELMEHPNIARLLDAGTAPGGRPYFVMDHVPGAPITVFCDERRTDIGARLALFLGVCEGVRHAHRKGIIHRDLKPSNILVTDTGTDPIPKIIDFGLAKAIDRPVSPETIHSFMGGVLGTPEYMAPEQWRGRTADIDTRADIYSLGVLLYELLVGETPLRMRGMDYEEMRRTALDVEPELPSKRLVMRGTEEASRRAALRRCDDVNALVRRTEGDLDWIVWKCLEKDRTRRYESVTDLAADVRRHLRNEPVTARRPTLGYVANRFVKRHGRALTAGSIIAVTVVSALTSGTLHALDRREARRRESRSHIETARMLAFDRPKAALAELDEARRLAPGLPELDIAETLVLARSGKQDQALARAEQTLRRHTKSSEAKAMLAGLLRNNDKTRSQTLEAEGRSQPDPNRLFDYYLASGLTDDTEAVTLLTRSIVEFPWNFDAVFQRGVRRYALEDFAGAKEDAELLLKIRPDKDLLWNLRGSAQFMLEPDTDAATHDFTRALEINPRQQIVYVNRAMAYRRSGKYEDALRDVDQALKLSPNDNEARALRGSILFLANRNEEAVEAFNQVIAEAAVGYGVFKDRGVVLVRLDRCDEAVADFTRAIQSDPRPAPDVLSVLYDLRGVARRNIEDFDGALTDARKAIELQPAYPKAHSNLGLALFFAGQRTEALGNFQRAEALDPGNPTYLMYRGMASWLVGDGKGALRDLDAARQRSGFEMVGLWRWEIYTILGRKAEAARLVAEVAGNAAQPTNVRAVAAALQGTRTEETVLADLPDGPYRLAAWYVFASRAAAEGKASSATEWWQKCGSFPKPSEAERILARLRLKLDAERLVD